MMIEHNSNNRRPLRKTRIYRAPDAVPKVNSGIEKNDGITPRKPRRFFSKDLISHHNNKPHHGRKFFSKRPTSGDMRPVRSERSALPPRNNNLSLSNSESNTKKRSGLGNLSLDKKGPRRITRSGGRRIVTKTHSRRVKTNILPINPSEVIPPLEEGVLRVIPLGGVEEIGRNMTAFEYGNDIIIVDAGIQFTEEETLGVDFILPNTKYLEDRIHKIRGLFITHGHLDHIGGIPFIINEIGNPTIYSKEFGAMMIKKRQEEFAHLPPLDVKVINGSEKIDAGAFKVSFFAISHAIPDSTGLIIETPLGKIAFIVDVRLEHLNEEPTAEEKAQYKPLEKDEFILFTLESTNIEKKGFSLPESQAIKSVNEIIKNVQGRLIISMFASQIERMVQFIETARAYSKKVIIEGRAMKTNAEIAKILGLLNVDNIIPIEEMELYPPDKIVFITTGAQGEEFAVLMRAMANTHKHLKITPFDTVLLSSSIIPGNDHAVSRLKDRLYRTGAKIMTYAEYGIHASGHGHKGELEWIHKQVKYKYFMPVHGNHYMLRIHAEMVKNLGIPASRIIIPDNGSIIEFRDNGNEAKVLSVKAPNERITVDGLSIGDIQEVVVKDRQLMSKEGMFVIVAVVDSKTGILKKSPEIISRGFVYLRESQDLLNQTRLIVKKATEEIMKRSNGKDLEDARDEAKKVVSDRVRTFLIQETGKQPIVIATIVTV